MTTLWSIAIIIGFVLLLNRLDQKTEAIAKLKKRLADFETR